MKRNQEDLKRLSDLYRDIHADEIKLRGDVMAFEQLTRDLARRMGVSEDKIGELIAQAHGGVE